MKVIFTGGGTAGHAMVNSIIIPYIQKKGIETSYVGSINGIEKQMIEKLDKVTYFPIKSGKLRRYFSLKNVTDLFNIIIGFFQAYFLLKKEKADLVYSSGGYVSVPVVWAAYFRRIPVVIRETDYSIGLANKLCIPFASELFLTFPETDTSLYEIPCHYDGMIIRPELFEKEENKEELSNTKPVCLVLGGSQGAEQINKLIWENLEELTKKYTVIHATGRGKKREQIKNTSCYQQIEFIDDMRYYYNQADIVMTRSGSNVVSECLLLGKKMVCIPLAVSQSRGEQMLNALFAKKNGNAIILENSSIQQDELLNALLELQEQKINSSYLINKEEVLRRIENQATFIKNNH